MSNAGTLIQPPATKPPISGSPLLNEREPLHSPADNDATGHGAATIGKSLVIKGEITGSESLYIDGKVEGSINLPTNRVTVGPNAQVNATITALEVIVRGKVVGNVNATDRLDVRSEGSIVGDAVAARISLADGAIFNGKIDIRRPAPDA